MLLGLPSIIKNLGTESFAIYTIFFTIISQLSILDFGLPKILIPKILKNDHFLGFIIQVVFIFFLIHLLIFFLVIKLSLFKSIFEGVNFSILVFASFITFLISTLRSVLEGLNKVTISVISRNSETIFQVIIFILLSFFLKLDKILIIYFLFQFTHSLLLFKIILKEKYLLNLSIKFNNSALFNIGVFFILVNFLGPLLTNFERYILKSNIDLQNLAYYSLSYTVASRLFLASSVLQPYIYVLSSKLNKPIDEIYNMAKPSIWTLTIIFYLVALSVLPYWLKNQYHNEISIFFKLAIIGVYGNTIARIPYDFLVAQGKVKTLTIMHVLETLFIPLGYLIYLKYGVFVLISFVSFRYLFECFILFFMTSISKKIIYEFLFEVVFLFTLTLLSNILLISILSIVFVIYIIKFIKYDFERLSNLFVN
jgi:O-antigen/teichoic acid export membrane protein